MSRQSHSGREERKKWALEPLSRRRLSKQHLSRRRLPRELQTSLSLRPSEGFPSEGRPLQECSPLHRRLAFRLSMSLSTSLWRGLALGGALGGIPLQRSLCRELWRSHPLRRELWRILQGGLPPRGDREPGRHQVDSSPESRVPVSVAERQEASRRESERLLTMTLKRGLVTVTGKTQGVHLVRVS